MHDVTQSTCRDFVTTRYATSTTYVLVPENTPQSTPFSQASDSTVCAQAVVLRSVDKPRTSGNVMMFCDQAPLALCAISNRGNQLAEAFDRKV
jgi:hypothetical protein